MTMVSFLSRFDELHEYAVKATGGLSDFGSDEYREPLRLLLGNYDQHARFDANGAQLVAQDAVGNLAGRLIEEQGFKSHPDFAAAKVEKPLFIIGLPRTGTTSLHRLIALDPALQTLPLWLACAPKPRPPRDTWESQPGFQQIAQALVQLYATSPFFKVMHPQSAEAADECRIAINHSFWSPGMCSSFSSVPDYSRWCFNTDARYAFQRYRKVLGLIAGGNKNRWLLKDPSHIWGWSSLLDTFPDACIVFTHRDPIAAMESFANLMFYSRKLCEPGLKPAELGNILPGYWGKALARIEHERKAVSPKQILDLHFDDITMDPVGVIERIYKHFELPISDRVAALWRERVAADPSGGHGGGKAYKLEEFGLTQKAIVAGVGAYFDRYLNVAACSCRQPT